MRKYLTLSDMGNSGGLCSQLQIYAGMLAVAKSNNMENGRFLSKRNGRSPKLII